MSDRKKVTTARKHKNLSLSAIQLTPIQTSHLLVTLFAGIPMALSFLLARWGGWSIDATLIAISTAGACGGAGMAAMVLIYRD